MPSIIVNFDWKKYQVDLAPNTGEPIGYSVLVCARGKGPTFRTLWRGNEGNPATPMPQRLKDILNVRGATESIAYVMGWN